MSGEVIIDLVVYVYRWFKLDNRLREAVGWRPAKAKIVDAKVRGGVTEILYTYQFEGGYFSNYEIRDLFWSQGASDYAKRLDRSAQLAIRVNPTKPEESVIFDEDQSEPTGIVMEE